MNTSVSDSIISKVIEYAKTNNSENDFKQIENYLKVYYQNVREKSIEKIKIADLYGAAISHLRLSKQRKHDENIISIYNPNLDSHGWYSQHTVIEMVTDDMPFIISSLILLLNKYDLERHIIIHPIYWHERTDDFSSIAVFSEKQNNINQVAESFIKVFVEKVPDNEVLQNLHRDIDNILKKLRSVVNDWKKMIEVIGDVDKQITNINNNNDKKNYEYEQALKFCEWLVDNNFVFLGIGEYSTKDSTSNDFVNTAALGILKEEKWIDDRLKLLLKNCNTDKVLTITKTDFRSTIHRPAYMDMIIINPKGTSSSPNLLFILGLFTSNVYNRSAENIPVLREKIKNVLTKLNIMSSGYSLRTLKNVMETYPRDELFQIKEHDLFNIVNEIFYLHESRSVRFFARKDEFGRYFSCMVYIPREKYDSHVRQVIEKILLDSYSGVDIDRNISFYHDSHARVHFLVFTDKDVAEVSSADIERIIVNATRTWEDSLYSSLLELYGLDDGLKLYKKYHNKFPNSFKDNYDTEAAANDIKHLESLDDENSLHIIIYKQIKVVEEKEIHIKLYSYGMPMELSSLIPVIENMGLMVCQERLYKIGNDDNLWIEHFTLLISGDQTVDLDIIKGVFEPAFVRIYNGEIENDGFNKLILSSALAADYVVVLRAYYKYMRQIKVSYSISYVIKALNDYPKITKLLISLFEKKFSPGNSENYEAIIDEIKASLIEIESLDQDRIFGIYVNLIESTLRTNFFQLLDNGQKKSYLSFKLASKKIANLPKPLPLYEIYVYSPIMEGIHLRGGMVARGGLRLSDRLEDFRTEVLGLMKAQNVKNAVIVPVGSKGGFIIKKEQYDNEQAIENYKIFISGLLDITDNLVNDKIVPPIDVVRYDGDDPYLVVAADKGTAKFSDIANSISVKRNFWLKDAFASGGSEGYDHKKIGITARGAWESVKKHFRKRGVNIQTTPFTVVGIGDMGGDVFGNGMLLSENIKLVAAFNHVHIFLDPDPDVKASYEERKRLFYAQKSGWESYEKKLISKGGGVYSRSLKKIEITAEVAKTFGINDKSLTPSELISKLLLAPVDLLWNGGIGTYIKSEKETDDQVMDRNNDPLRVNAKNLRCKIIGEGGNLGVTQRGRIEFCENGGLCFTDAIDNSGGVDTSDIEVNLKILLEKIVAAGDMTKKQRNILLEEMTDEVTKIVLMDNYAQALILSIISAMAVNRFNDHIDMIEMLEKNISLNRKLEFLPDEEMIVERLKNRKGLYLPELAILLSYSKLWLYDVVYKSSIVGDPYLIKYIIEYFPSKISKNYNEYIASHSLYKEILSTVIINRLINLVGPDLFFRLHKLTRVDVPVIVKMLVAVIEILHVKSSWRDIELLDNIVTDNTQQKLFIELIDLVEHATLWLIRNVDNNMNIEEIINIYAKGIDELVNKFSSSLSVAYRYRQKSKVKKLLSENVPANLSNKLASFAAMKNSLDIVNIANNTKQDISIVARVFYEIEQQYQFSWIENEINNLLVTNYWHSKAKYNIYNELKYIQAKLATHILSISDCKRGSLRINNWEQKNDRIYNKLLEFIGDLKTETNIDFQLLSVALGDLKNILSIN